ncbi:10871_t:CDS:2 [Paraglomus occultum]|uniref:10871_t:CDS:1 n=1 Tax=Paraglomus occultum TaxID=144539 RepID=A0A9N9ALA8_9GLOM|nr:10871_t:CDS:2 [Paraglomus occultum]
MNALPVLNGYIGYLFTSQPLILEPSAKVRFGELVDRFYINHQPITHPQKVDDVKKPYVSKDYILYSRLHIPTTRLEILYSKKLSPWSQFLFTGINEHTRRGAPHVTAEIQYDAGKWCTEAFYSTNRSLIGLRGLYHLADDSASAAKDSQSDNGIVTDNASTPKNKLQKQSPSRLAEFHNHSSDESEEFDNDMVEGLKGQWTVGTEIYYGASERSGGISTGLRYRTLPQHPMQSPLTFTYLFNPIMGHMSAAFAAQVSDTLALCPRFDFNMFSYESDLMIGCEWWQKVKRETENNAGDGKAKDDVQGIVKATFGVAKGIKFLWEGRYGKLLFSLGLVADLRSRLSPIQSVGLELQYFS